MQSAPVFARVVEREQDEDQVLDLGQRQLTSWSRLERLVCRVRDTSDGPRAGVEFGLTIALAHFARTWMELDSPGLSVSVKLSGEGDAIRCAGRVTRDTGTSWFSLAVTVVPGRDELGLVVRDLLLFGPDTIEAQELLRILGAPLDLFTERAWEPIQSWIRPLPLLAAVLKQTTHISLPARIDPIELTASAVGERLEVTGRPARAGIRDASGGIWPRIPRSGLSESLDAALERHDWDSAREVVDSLVPADRLSEYGLFELVRRCPEPRAAELTRVRRAAQAGDPGALCALIARLRATGQPYRAIHWQRLLSRVAAGLGPLTAWAAEAALAEYVGGLSRISADQAPLAALEPIVLRTPEPDPVVASEDPKEALRQALRTGPLALELLARIRGEFEAREDWRGLLRVLEDALSVATRPDDRMVLHRELAHVKLALGVPSRAAPHFEALLAANQDDVDSREFLRGYYQREGLHPERIRLEASIARHLPGSEGAKALLALADDAAQNNLAALSRSLLVEACAANPADGPLLGRLTTELEPLEEWDTLVAAWKRRLPYLTQAWEKVQGGMKIAGYLKQRGDLEGAERLYRGVLRTEPELAAAIDGLAGVLEQRGDWAGAADQLQHLSRLVGGRERVEVALRLGRLYADKLTEPEIADSWYREALAESPGDERAAEGVIKQLEAREDWQALTAFLEKRIATVEAGDARRELLLYLGDICLVRLGDQARALACFQKAEGWGGA